MEQNGESPSVNPYHVSCQVEVPERGDPGEQDMEHIPEKQGPRNRRAYLVLVGILNGAHHSFIERHKGLKTLFREAGLEHRLDALQRFNQRPNANRNDEHAKDSLDRSAGNLSGTLALEEQPDQRNEAQYYGGQFDQFN
jgi:hypothetical protein